MALSVSAMARSVRQSRGRLFVVLAVPIVLAVLALQVAATAGQQAGAPPPAASTAAPVSTSTSQTSRTITMAGTGTAKGTPDVMLANLGVEVLQANVSDALTGANAAMAAVQKAVTDGGVAPEDMQTSDLSVYRDSTANAYRVAEGLTVKIRKMDTAGSVVSAALAAAGDAARLNGMALEISDRSALLAQARKDAVQDATERATTYAQAAGLTLGAVQRISESPPGAPPGPYPLDSRADASSVPVAPGQQEVTATVTVEWALA